MIIMMNSIEFIKKAKLKHGDTYDYSKVIYNGYSNEIIIICDIHGDFLQTPDHHLNGNKKGSGCRECGIIRASQSRLHNTEKFIETAKQIHNDKYDYSLVNYKHSKKKVKIICRVHGTFKVTPNKHLSKKRGCQKCSYEARGKHNALTTEEFVEVAKQTHGNKYDYSKVNYIRGDKYVIIGCPIHGNIKQTPKRHLKGYGCSFCGASTKCISKGENEWLAYLNTPNDYEHRQVTIKIKNKWFKVDGFDPTTNTVYEYNGDYWHGNPKKYKSEDINKKNKKTYGELYQATLKKEQDLINADYKVISIWGSDWRKFKKEAYAD